MRIFIAMTIVCLFGVPAMAQGVRDPSTPNTGMGNSFSEPSRPARPNAVRNKPPQSANVPLGVRRHPSREYRNYRRDGRGR